MIWLSQSAEFREDSSCVSPKLISGVNAADYGTPIQLSLHWVNTWYSSINCKLPSFVVFNFLAFRAKNCTFTGCTIIYVRTALSFWRYWLEILARFLRYSIFMNEKQSIEWISAFFTSSYTTIQKRLNWKHYISKSIDFVVFSIGDHTNNW